jgi:hypothetical protein
MVTKNQLPSLSLKRGKEESIREAQAKEARQEKKISQAQDQGSKSGTGSTGHGQRLGRAHIRGRHAGGGCMEDGNWLLAPIQGHLPTAHIFLSSDS